ncbi:uncharacterized protein EHS24_004880 [Apiotrichum porosum]|uniref:Lipid droplet-associated perilipin protein n=1 Tax=Apiotrichum porosum TaxID=105984 RepID=A0A427Y696_9TREE|nr:uncharacterized protein EHS24_004880 [Apiotrichum porosum]RSH86610.1 hypothetical protein EHS24_004880 [Apiotrichum porosum]
MAATAQQPNGTTPSFKIVERLDSVPVLHDSYTYAQSLINSTQLTANLYQTALGLAVRSYDAATPVLVRAKPLLESADGLAVATVDRVEVIFPYPFKTQTQDLIGVKQAKGVYDARVAPLIQQATPVIQDVISKTAALNHELGARASAVVTQSTEISHALLEQLHTLRDQSKELPHQLSEVLTKVTADVKSIVLAKEGTYQEKTNKLAAYVVENVRPVIEEAYAQVLGAKKAAEDKVAKATEKVSEKAPAVSN